MTRLRLIVFLCAAAAPLVSCKKTNQIGTPGKPDSGSFVQNAYRNDFFGFSYPLPKEWHRSRVTPAGLPPGAYYLFIADRYTDQPLLTRVIVVADPERSKGASASGKEYVSAFVRGEVNQSHAEVTREPSLFSSGGSDFYRADYKFVNDGTTFYSALVSIPRRGYWLSWSFVAPSQQDLDQALTTLQHVSFDSSSTHP